MKWTKVENKLPDTDRKVIALSGQDTLLAWVEDGEWYIAARMKLGGVTKWMEMPGEPKDFAYWLRQLKEWWSRRKVNIQETSDFFSGWGTRNAQLSQKVIYYENQKTGEIRMGAPEQFPVSKGFSKVICNNTSEAEKWSEKLRQYNYARESKIDEKREAIEGEAAKEIRSEIHNRIANSKSKYGRVFLENYLQRMDRAEGRRRMTREEFNHSEGYERGH